MKFFSLLSILAILSNIASAENDFVLYPEPVKAPISLFETEDGNLETLGNYQGRVTILNFWATWCKPCVIEMPSLNRLQATYKAKGLSIIPLVGDTEIVSKVRSFYRRYKLRDLRYYIDNEAMTGQSYQVTGVPASFIFNKDGKLVAYVDGSINWMSQDNRKFIEKLLAE